MNLKRLQICSEDAGYKMPDAETSGVFEEHYKLQRQVLNPEGLTTK